MCWFNIQNYTINDTYYLFDYYDDVNNLGFKITINNKNLKVRYNELDFTLALGEEGTSTGLSEETWYGYILNIDQRQRKISQYIYKRNVDDEELGSRISTTILKKVNSIENDLDPVEFKLENITNIKNLYSKNSNEFMLNYKFMVDIFYERAMNDVNENGYPLNEYVFKIMMMFYTVTILKVIIFKSASLEI
jgi:hypothetical protein